MFRGKHRNTGVDIATERPSLITDSNVHRNSVQVESPNCMSALKKTLGKDRGSLHIGKAIPLQAWHRPWGFQQVEAPRFQRQSARDGGRLSVQRTGHLNPLHEIPWYSFLLEAESTPEPQCGRKDYVNEKSRHHGSSCLDCNSSKV